MSVCLRPKVYIILNFNIRGIPFEIKFKAEKLLDPLVFNIVMKALADAIKTWNINKRPRKESQDSNYLYIICQIIGLW